MVGEPIEQRPGQTFGAEHLGPFVEGKIAGQQGGAAFVALAEHLEQEFDASLGEPTFADAILDRIVHNAHRIDLDGPSLRKTIAENINANAVDRVEGK